MKTVAPSSKRSEPIVIPANAVYSAAEARIVLGLAKASLGREIRLGRLRVAKRCGKYFFMGSWLIEWIEGGEVTRKPRRSNLPCTGNCEARS